MNELFATCAKGAEKVLSAELAALGAKRIRPLVSGVAFFGDIEVAYRALLWLRSASRVLLILDRIAATDADELYEGIVALPWEEHVPASGSIAVDARGVNDELRDTRFIAMRVKDAVVDRLRQQCGERPSVVRDRPDVRINVALRAKRATVALDLSGEPLHRRGYRRAEGVEAPLKENLAATMILASGWDMPWYQKGREQVWSFIDPLCGSGTLAIEAAMIALDVAPGILRDHWGCTGWLKHDADLWDRLVEEADSKAESAAEKEEQRCANGGLPLIYASDIDPVAVRAAEENARRAGVSAYIEFSVGDIAGLSLPATNTEVTATTNASAAAIEDVAAVEPEAEAAVEPSATAAPVAAAAAEPSATAAPVAARGLLACNPPYGERLASASQLPVLYASLAALCRSAGNLDICVITPDERIDVYLGAQPVSTISTFNGPLETDIKLYGTADAAALTQMTPVDASQFEARLRKMAQHRAKWARRSGVSCYRVYDADLPDFAVAIDLYQGAATDDGRRCLHIAEYAPPKEIDPQMASARLAAALELAPTILDVSADQVFLKVRQRARGGSQYAELSVGRDERTSERSSSRSSDQGTGRSSDQGTERDLGRSTSRSASRSASRGASSSKPARSSGLLRVREGGLLFEVDLAGRLDTGLFLDHRMTRELLRSKAQGQDTLNLFAYTGTASVYMAAGRAKSVTTVDLSQTYLNWAQRNLELNGFKGQRYRFEQADATRWVQDHRHDAEKYGLIFVDPPTFSNSSRMGERTWDVQRDHAELLIAVSRMLTPDASRYSPAIRAAYLSLSKRRT